MSARHTEGPWAVSWDQSRLTIINEDTGEHVAALFRSGIGPTDENLRAKYNSRLIAAAPDLLRVAELVVSWLDEEPGAHKLCDAARAAIRKATGADK